MSLLPDFKSVPFSVPINFYPAYIVSTGYKLLLTHSSFLSILQSLLLNPDKLPHCQDISVRPETFGIYKFFFHISIYNLN